MITETTPTTHVEELLPAKFSQGLYRVNKFNSLAIFRDHYEGMKKSPLGLILRAYGLALIAMLVLHGVGIGGWVPVIAFWLGGAAMVFLLPAVTVERGSDANTQRTAPRGSGSLRTAET